VSDEIVVRMGELAVTKNPGTVLTGLGLGSCIGLCGYDPVAKVAGMAHIVLPAATGSAESAPAKSADVAVPNFLDAMLKAGARRDRIRIAIAGGAQLFQFRNAESRLDVGARNILSVRQIFNTMRIREMASDVGGSSGRTVKLYASDGTVTVRQAGRPESTLVVMTDLLRKAA
jgi:chemotaxis protein CheD